MKRMMIIFVSVLCLAALTGCHEGDLQQFYIVTAAAVDVEDGRYKLTLEGSANRLDESKNPRPALQTGRGETITQCLQDIQSRSGNLPYMRHSILIALSQASINEVLDELVEYIQGEDSIRLNVRAVMAKEGEAAMLLNDSEFASSRILKSFTGGAKRLTTADVQLYDLMYCLDSPGIDGWMPVSGHEGTEGIALLSDYSYAGYLEPRLVPSFLMMTGKAEGGSLTAEVGGKYVSFSLTDCSRRLDVSLVNGVPRVSVGIKADFRLRDMPEHTAEVYEAALEKRLVSEGHEVFEQLKASACDALGAGQQLSRLSPSVWEQAEGRWHEIFSQAELELDIDCRLESRGKTEGME